MTTDKKESNYSALAPPQTAEEAERLNVIEIEHQIKMLGRRIERIESREEAVRVYQKLTDKTARMRRRWHLKSRSDRQARQKPVD